ncbi:unnamed protein product [Cyclocybe aegerita]|uniref:Uncharacterized protein n=1 Tax=Cyclocybe aegerita TaxID=1973307 RepID=A0A8S0XMK8_CYCAE|nr:unnamed protein product [Cyclocybe aegerita]
MPSSIDSLTDEQVYTLIANRTYEQAIGTMPKNLGSFAAAWRITPDAVVKRSCSSSSSKHEAFIMDYVRKQTSGSVYIPQVRKVLPTRKPPKSSGNRLVAT